MSSSGFAGQTALITGVASGVGAATARALAEAGATIVGIDVDVANGSALFAELGPSHHFFELDVSSADDWARVVEEAERRAGPIEVVHLNAGRMLRPQGTPLASNDLLTWLTVEGYRRVTAVNIDGVAFGLLTLLPRLRERGRGRVVVTSSITGLVPLPRDPVYSMSKHALVGLVRGLGPTLAEEGISISAICPVGIATGFSGGGPGSAREVSANAGQVLEPAEVAAAVLMLLEAPRAGEVWVLRADGDRQASRYDFPDVRNA